MGSQQSRLPLHFILHRLHSLVGVGLIGLFLIHHLYWNAKVLGPQGASVFNQSIENLHRIPFFTLLEVFFLYLPLLFYAVYGLVLVRQTKITFAPSLSGGNVRYLLHRVTGAVAIIFIGFHIYETRLLSYFAHVPLDYLWMARIFESSWKVGFYFIGVTAIIFHFCNGLWSFLISWGVTVSRSSQKKSLYFCSGLFIVLTVVNFLVMTHFIYHYQKAPGFLDGLLNFIRNYL